MLYLDREYLDFHDREFNMEKVAIRKDENFGINLQAVLTELDTLELPTLHSV